jgi:ADP-heptose:LPS heptosyltransferase
MTDFADAAAIVANLDLVICVDTAMAHLTAALGKPCWLLLPDYMTDWRWLSEGSGSLWYPGCMRLFRQKQAGDWSAVIDELVRALEEFACAKLSQ